MSRGWSWILKVVAASLLAAWGQGAARAEDTAAVASLRKWTRAELPKLVELYRHFHAHPEL